MCFLLVNNSHKTSNERYLLFFFLWHLSSGRYRPLDLNPILTLMPAWPFLQSFSNMFCLPGQFVTQWAPGHRHVEVPAARHRKRPQTISSVVVVSLVHQFGCFVLYFGAFAVDPLSNSFLSVIPPVKSPNQEHNVCHSTTKKGDFIEKG